MMLFVICRLDWNCLRLDLVWIILPRSKTSLLYTNAMFGKYCRITIRYVTILRAPCGNDKCLFTTNMDLQDIIPEFNRENVESIKEWEDLQ